MVLQDFHHYNHIIDYRVRFEKCLEILRNIEKFVEF